MEMLNPVMKVLSAKEVSELSGSAPGWSIMKIFFCCFTVIKAANDFLETTAKNRREVLEQQ